MALVNFKEMLRNAKRERKAVAAINVANLETLSAVVSAAEMEKAPIIIQVYQRLFGDRSIRYIAGMAIKMAGDSAVPVALHLDHGTGLDQIRQAVDLGFSSVMIDGSKLPFEDNVRLTSEAVEIAHAANLSIEGEIGHIPTANDVIPFCDPVEALEFARVTRVDALAAAIGTAHGFYKKEPVLNFDIAETISSAIDIPLVLHGGTGVPEKQIREAMKRGVAKVNIATEFQNMFLEETKAQLLEIKEFKPVDLFFRPVVAKLSEYVRGIIRLLND